MVALLFGLVVIGALAIPALGMKTHVSNLDTVPDSIPAVATIHDIQELFPAQADELDVVVRGSADDRSQIAAELDDLAAAAASSGDFSGLAAPVATSSDGRTSVARLALRSGLDEDGADAAVEQLRDDLVPATVTTGEVAVGGEVAGDYDAGTQQSDRLPWVIVFVLTLTLVMMAVAFRSVPIAVLSTLLNLASVGVAFGLISLVFQHGWGESVLDFTSPGFVIDWIPLFTLVVLVGLSMDYHVFVVSRICEHVLDGVPAREAVRRGVSETAGVITSAAAVMVSVFAIFASLSLLEMKMLGVGLAVAILLDATLIRLVVLPAALVLLGERAWWPRRPPRSGDDSKNEHEEHQTVVQAPRFPSSEKTTARV